MEAITKEQQAENRMRWAAALRSGVYEQCRTILFDGDKRCCLAVGAVVLGRNIKEGDHIHHYTAVMHGMGFRMVHDGDDTIHQKFVDANDSEKRSFPQIADLIEQHPEWFEGGAA
jgi:hypothetical protein